MSCEKTPNKIARLAQIGGGIAQLAGKRSFYAGVAVGAGGAVGGMALAAAIRRRRNGAESGKRQPVPIEPARGTRAKPRQIPQAARQRPGTRANPKQIPRKASDAAGSRTNPKKIPRRAPDAAGSRTNPKKIPVRSTSPAETRLQAAQLSIRTGGGQSFTPTSSYRVVRPDGSDTGLAVTPCVWEGDGGQLVEDEKRWGVTHTASGNLISGPYDTLSQAQGLATQLSDLRWTGSRVPATDVEQAKQIISAYQPGPDAGRKK